MFFNFLYLSWTLQYILTYSDPIENILILSCHSFHIQLKKKNIPFNMSFNLYTFFIPFYVGQKVKSNTTVSTHYWIVCFSSINICYDIFISFEVFLFLLEYVPFRTYQNLLHFQHWHIMLSNEFLLIHTH